MFATELKKTAQEKLQKDLAAYLVRVLPQIKETVTDEAKAGKFMHTFLFKDLDIGSDNFGAMRLEGIKTALTEMGLSFHTPMTHDCGLHDNCNTCSIRSIVVSWS